MTALQNRRRLLQCLAAAFVAAGHPDNASASSPASPRQSRLSLIKPRALKRGDLVGVVAPSGFMVDEEIERKVKGLEAAGFRVKLAQNIRAARGNTGGTIAERVDDLHAMFMDREVNAVWAGRGGSGASQLLPHLDYAMMRRHAKIFIGYSDATALLVAINKLSRIVTFHGPVAFTTAVTDYSLSQIEAVLFDPGPETTIYMAVENARRGIGAPEYRLRTLKPGVAEGRLIGGNLSVLSAMIGTRFQAETNGAILFLEDVGEAPYRIDRMLTQLAQNQDMRKIAGAMLGVFRQRDSAEEDKLTMEMALNDHFANLGVPAVAGFSFGHIANQFTIPLGIRARLDTEEATLTLLERAVSGK
jgi:muramoyltetrapeptide carboxypeptidase